jgi:hypothetical protein
MMDALWNILKLVSLMGLGVLLLIGVVFLFVKALLSLQD